MMIQSKTIELHFRGELIERGCLINSTKASFMEKWKKRYGKKFSSKEVEVKTIIVKYKKPEKSVKKSSPDFPSIHVRASKGIVKPGYSDYQK